MTLKELLNQTLAEVGFGEYTAFFSSSRPDALQVLALAKRELNDLSKKPWQALIETHSLTMDTSTEYDLPADFRQFVPDTAFTESYAAEFPTSAEDWAYYDAKNLTTGINLRIRLMGDKIHMSNPEDGQALRIEYISNYPVAGAGGTRKQRFTADDDSIVLNDDLFMLGVNWRFRRAKGMEWQSYFADYQQMKRRELATDKNSRTLNMGGPLEQEPGPDLDLYVS